MWTQTTPEIALLILNIQWKVLWFSAENWPNTFKCNFTSVLEKIFTLTYCIYSIKLMSNLFECYAVSYVGKMMLWAQSCQTL